MHVTLSSACLAPLILLLGGTPGPAGPTPGIGDTAEQLSARIAAMEAFELAQPVADGIDALTKRLTEDTQYVTARDGWLYGRSLRFERFMAAPGADEEHEAEHEPGDHYTPGGAATLAIVDFHEQLSERGIELLVVPIPTRLHVYPELVVDASLEAEFEGHAPGLTRFLLELTERGVGVVDLLPALSRARARFDGPDAEQVFPRANGHWSPKGVVVAARAIAERLRETPWYADLKRRELPEPDRFERAWSYRSQKLAEGAEPPLLAFERVLNGRGRMTEYDTQSPVLVLGDSFVSLYTPEGADLARQLHRFAGFPMDVISNPGGAAQGSRVSLARRRGGPRDKRVVIWMWASESLMMPANKWKTINVFQR